MLRLKPDIALERIKGVAVFIGSGVFAVLLGVAITVWLLTPDSTFPKSDILKMMEPIFWTFHLPVTLVMLMLTRLVIPRVSEQLLVPPRLNSIFSHLAVFPCILSIATALHHPYLIELLKTPSAQHFAFIGFLISEPVSEWTYCLMLAGLPISTAVAIVSLIVTLTNPRSLSAAA